jgi:hypothetical protein
VCAQATSFVLRAPTAVLSEAFIDIRGVRELSDGRIIVVDFAEKRVVVSDVSWRTVERIGRIGEGPGEYRSPFRIAALSGDSTLVCDGHSGRSLILDRVDIVQTIGRDAGPAGKVSCALIGATPEGAVLGTRHYASRVAAREAGSFGTMPGYADSIVVLRVNRKALRVDTVACIAAAPRGMRLAKRTLDGIPTTYFLANPLAVDEQAVAFPDGWIALVRMSPYRVEWITGQGVRLPSVPLPHSRIAVDDREKRAAIARTWLTPRYTGPRWTPDDFPPWPSELPPIAPNALHATPEGNVLIRQMPSAARNATVYDLVDRSGRLSSRLELPGNAFVVGFGRKAVFVARVDADDLQYLERHTWPLSPGS